MSTERFVKIKGGVGTKHLAEGVQKHMPSPEKVVKVVAAAFQQTGRDNLPVHQALGLDPERIVTEVLQALDLNLADTSIDTFVRSSGALRSTAYASVVALRKSLGTVHAPGQAADLAEDLANLVAQVDWRLRRLALLEERLNLTRREDDEEDSNYDAHTWVANVEQLVHHLWPDVPVREVLARLKTDHNAVRSLFETQSHARVVKQQVPG